MVHTWYAVHCKVLHTSLKVAVLSAEAAVWRTADALTLRCFEVVPVSEWVQRVSPLQTPAIYP